MSLSQVLSSLGRPVAYYPKLAKLAGSVNAAIFLSQFMYWRGRGFEGEIYKSQAELEEETGLVPEEQRTAAKKLIALGVLTVTKKGVPARNHYLFDWDALDHQWNNFVSKSSTTSRRESPPLDGAKPDDQSSIKSSTSRRESPPLDGAKLDDQSSRKSTTRRGESPRLDEEKVRDFNKKRETTKETTHTHTQSHENAQATSDGSRVCVVEGQSLDQAQDKPKPTPEGAMAVSLRKQGVDVTSIHPLLLGWIAAGLDTATLLEFVAVARQTKPAPQRIPAAYLDAIVQASLKPAREVPSDSSRRSAGQPQRTPRADEYVPESRRRVRG